MERLSYFIRRLLLVIPTFLGITFLVFALTQFVPGGPVEQRIAQMRYFIVHLHRLLDPDQDTKPRR